MSATRMALMILVAVAGLTSGAAFAEGSCSIPPPPPTPPDGCRALVPVCVCDATSNCYWQFQCVR